MTTLGEVRDTFETLGELLAWHDDPDMCRAHRQLVSDLKHVLKGLEERVTQAWTANYGNPNPDESFRQAIRAELTEPHGKG